MVAKTEQGVKQEGSTYEGFANQPFYVDINRQTVALIPQVERVVDIATGTGAIIEQMLDLGKLLPGFEVRGYDIDRDALRDAEKKLGNPQIRFGLASAEFIPLGDGWADAVTFCNAIHLTNAQYSLDEAVRIVKPGGTVTVNTAYANDLAYPDRSRRTWGVFVATARKIAIEKYGVREFDDHPSQDILKHSSEDIRRMAEEAGLEKISMGKIIAKMYEKDLGEISKYREFTEGALPGIKYEIATACLQRAVPITLEKRGTDHLPRGWLVMHGFRKAA